MFGGIGLGFSGRASFTTTEAISTTTASAMRASLVLRKKRGMSLRRSQKPPLSP